MNSQIPELINFLDFKGIKFTIKDGMISINLNEEKKDLVKIDEKQTQLNEKMENSIDTISYTGQRNVIYFDIDKGQYYKLTSGLEIDGKSKKDYFDENYFSSHYSRDKNCFGTYVEVDGEECQKWASAVFDINNDNVEFINFLKTKDGDFFDIADTNIGDMHPVMAVQILKKFGFRKYYCYDVKAGTTLYKIESIEHWLKHVIQCHLYTKNSEIERLINSQNGYKLKRYLALIYGYVNCNPGIINKNYIGVDALEEQNVYFKVPEEAPKFGLKPPTSHKREKFHLVGQSFDVIVLTYRRIITTFKNKGINFPAEHQNELEKMIRKYNVIQDELVKTLCYLEEYANVMDLTLQSKPKTVEQLEERFGKLDEKQNSMEQSLLGNLMRLALVEEDNIEYHII